MRVYLHELEHGEADTEIKQISTFQLCCKVLENSYILFTQNVNENYAYYKRLGHCFNKQGLNTRCM